jgi:hypothetical protein
MEDVLVGVTTPAEGWRIEKSKKAMEAGKTAFTATPAPSISNGQTTAAGTGSDLGPRRSFP